MSKKNQTKGFIIVTTLLVLQLAFLYVVKYLNQQLTFSNFSLLKIGNIINLLLYTGIITGIYFINKKEKSLINNKITSSFLIISWLLLIISFISTRIKILSASV
ncbi:MAG: hypothetical protein OEM46_08200, partial [Ignavibacteria bacterium]|nr:hypothetical protein [Ignavibacteria bacterium]